MNGLRLRRVSLHEIEFGGGGDSDRSFSATSTFELWHRRADRHLVVAVVSCVLLLTPTFVTLTMSVLFFIPSKLGLIDPVRPEERITIHIPSEHDIELSRDGKYHVFSTYLIPPMYEIVLISWTTGERVAVWPYRRYHP